MNFSNRTYRALVKWPLALAAAITMGYFTTGVANAYYGSTYTYYLHDSGTNYVYLTTSGTWTGWTGYSIVNVRPRIDVQVVNYSSRFTCWRMEIYGPYGILVGYNEFESFIPSISVDNTPTLRYGPAATAASTGGEATWRGAVGNGGTICNSPYSVSSLAYNTFRVPYGTNYNNQWESAWPYATN